MMGVEIPSVDRDEIQNREFTECLETLLGNQIVGNGGSRTNQQQVQKQLPILGTQLLRFHIPILQQHRCPKQLAGDGLHPDSILLSSLVVVMDGLGIFVCQHVRHGTKTCQPFISQISSCRKKSRRRRQ